jgi:hypothetical protein
MNWARPNRQVELAAIIRGIDIGKLLRSYLEQFVENCKRDRAYLDRVVMMWNNPHRVQIDENKWQEEPRLVPDGFINYCYTIVMNNTLEKALQQTTPLREAA